MKTPDYINEWILQSTSSDSESLARYAMQIQDLSNYEDRDYVFVQQLILTFSPLVSILKDYALHGKILDPGYEVEKLKAIKNVIENSYTYFSKREEQERGRRGDKEDGNNN